LTDTIGIEGLDFGTLSTIDVRGTTIELFQAGAGAPLLFLHGLDGIDGAAAILAELARSYSVYAPSHPGFGGSGQREGITRVDDLGYFYLDLMDALALDAPVVVGAGFGGWLAKEILTKEPRRASSLVLVSPLGLVTAERREQYVADIFVMSRQELGKRLQLGEPGPLQNIMSMPEGPLRRAMRNDEAASLYGWTPYMCNPQLADRLHRISSPTLVLWGAEDAIIGPVYREKYAQALPQAQVESLAAAGHRAHGDQPQALAERISAFAGS
jgi:pimeloyl-ACP methyl ester carboxylesterase